MNPMLNIAIQAIHQAGNFIIKQYEILNTNNITKIINKRNLLIKITETINLIISDIIKKYYPLHTIITQNKHFYSKINNEIQWIINPLDNQINFIKHLPYFSSSISVKIKGNTEISVIYDPIHNDLFTASKGQGTQLNGYRIHNLNKKILHNHIIITCFPFYKQNIIMNILNKIHKIQKNINFRYSNTITLDLAYVAAGRIDILIAINLKEYNFDCGALLIKEAGGLIFYIDNKSHNSNIKKNIIVGHPKLIKFIISEIIRSKKNK